MEVRDLNDASRAFMCVYIHKMLYDNGRLCDYEPCEPKYIDPDMDFEAIWNGLWNVSDAVWSWNSPSSDIETMYFSHPDIMEYYRLCRVYGKKHGVKLADNPYMKAAAEYVRLQLDQGCYACEYILQTKINHDWASGIVFRMWPEFEWHFELLTLIINIFNYYTEQLGKLKSELETVISDQLKEAA